MRATGRRESSRVDRLQGRYAGGMSVDRQEISRHSAIRAVAKLLSLTLSVHSKLQRDTSRSKAAEISGRGWLLWLFFKYSLCVRRVATRRFWARPCSEDASATGSSSLCLRRSGGMGKRPVRPVELQRHWPDCWRGEDSIQQLRRCRYSWRCQGGRSDNSLRIAVTLLSCACESGRSLADPVSNTI